MSNLEFNVETLPSDFSFQNTPVVADENAELNFSSKIQPFYLNVNKFAQSTESPQNAEAPIHLTEADPFITDRPKEENLIEKPIVQFPKDHDIAKICPIQISTNDVITEKDAQVDHRSQESQEFQEEKSISEVHSEGEVKSNNDIDGQALHHFSRSKLEREDFFRNKGHGHNPRKEFVEHILEHWVTRLILAVFTIFALFNDSIGSLIGSIAVDEAFDVVSLISFCVFVLEFLAALYVEEGYAWSLYFYFDILATLSVFLHIEFLLEDFFPEMVAHSSEMLEASRAIRLFTGHGALIQLTQLLQVGKVFNQVKKHKKKQELDENLEDLRNYNIKLANLGETTPKDVPEIPSLQIRGRAVTVMPVKYLQTMMRTFTSRAHNHQITKMEIEEERDKISQEIKRKALRNAEVYRKKKMTTMKTLGDTTFPDVQAAHIKELRIAKKKAFSTLKMVIVVSLVLLMILPLFYADFYYYPIDGQEYDMELLAKILDDDSVSDSAKETLIKSFVERQRETEPELVYFSIGKEVLLAESHLNFHHLRHHDYKTILVSSRERGVLKSIVSLHHHERLKAILGLINIIFICIALVLVTLLLLKDTNVLLMEPFDHIIRKINQIAHDPLSAKKYRFTADQIHKDFLHTALRLEDAIVKIVKLLILGFGEGGTAIITENIEVTGTLNPQIHGDKKVAIFAVCDIRHFVRLSEILQEDVMLFVNSVADIVHSMTDKFGGAASQNRGDSFLLVWKFDEANIKREKDGHFKVINNRLTENIADCALISALKTCARIARDPGVMKYSEHLGPHDKIEVGFGLHVGWAIEGAIGTEYKIDATYLSANVNIATELEAGTGHYKVPILFSEEFYEILSEPMKKKCREIDVILVDKSPNPLTVFTVDFEVERMSMSKDRSRIPLQAKRSRQKKKKAYLQNIIKEEYVYTQLITDKELVYILKNQHTEWKKLFKEGFEAYRGGNWSLAKEKFEECLLIKEKEKDEPTHNLLHYMRKHKFMAPAEWKYRHTSFGLDK